MMKAAENVKKIYKVVDKSCENDYLASMNVIFENMLRWREEKVGKVDLKGYEKQVNSLKRVHDELVEDGVVLDGQRLWRALYAVYVAPKREKMFENEIALRKAKKLQQDTVPCIFCQPIENS